MGGDEAQSVSSCTKHSVCARTARRRCNPSGGVKVYHTLVRMAVAAEQQASLASSHCSWESLTTTTSSSILVQAIY